MKKSLIVLGFCTLLGSSVLGQKNPWIGIWKLDPAKSSFTGYTVTFEQEANGVMRMRTAASAMAVRFDGAEHPAIMPNRAAAWTNLGNNGFDTVTRVGGVVVSKTHRAISGDNKTLTRTTEITRRDGTTAGRDVETFTRVSGTTGLVGTWRSTRQQRTAEEAVVILPARAGSFRTIMPDFKQTIEGKLDGSDIQIKDTKRLPGASIAITKPSARRIEYTIKSNGKVLYKGYQTLNATGTILTDVSWAVDKEQEKATGVYVKQ